MRGNRQTPGPGPLASTGPAGAVGSPAIVTASNRGVEGHTINGEPDHAGDLIAIGAHHLPGRHALATTTPMALALAWVLAFGLATASTAGATSC